MQYEIVLKEGGGIKRKIISYFLFCFIFFGSFLEGGRAEINAIPLVCKSVTASWQSILNIVN